jgi:hypothetical protein
VPVTAGSVMLGITNADSFSFEADTASGAITALMTVYCFE